MRDRQKVPTKISGSMRKRTFSQLSANQVWRWQQRFCCGLLFALVAALPVYQLLFAHAHADQSRVQVGWVDDGDTIVLATGERVRYLGINAPEIAHDYTPGEPYGKRAKSYNKRLVMGRAVKLELEEERRDHYGRLLAYVFLEDGTFVNGELVRRGYAHLLHRQPRLRYWERLLELQRDALKEKRGIWSVPAVKPEKYYVGNKRSWVFHRPHCKSGLRTAQANRVQFKSRYEALYHGFSPGRRCKP